MKDLEVSNLEMSNQKACKSIDTIDVMRISQELILKNRTVYKHLAADIPVQQILDEIIPQLIKLYKGHVIQIVQFKNDLAYINLAVLFDDSYTLTMHQSKIGKSRKLMRAINDKYGSATITIINCRYNDVHDSKKNSTHLYKARSGNVIWTRKETEENNHE